MSLLNETGLESRLKQLRAGVRVNSRVRVAVEWLEDGRMHKAEGHTLDISLKGCLAVIPQGFTVGQRLKLINLMNQNTCEANVIWRGHEGRAGWELGLSLPQGTEEFWGLEF